MSKCSICRNSEGELIWQPFGPSDDIYIFVLPGSNYQGYPAFDICDGCKRKIENEERVSLYYKGHLYIFYPDDADLDYEV